MELSAQQEDELKSVLASNPNGISYADMCKECYSFDSIAEISKALHQAVHLGIAYREGKLYYDLDGYNKFRADSAEVNNTKTDSPSPSSITAEIKKLIGAVAPPEAPTLQPKVITSTVKRTDIRPLAVKDKDAGPVTGNLRRSKSLGAAAMALYKLRNDRALTLDNIATLTGVAKTALSAVMTKLVASKYAIKSGSARCPEFKWSNRFSYPFSSYSTDDSSLVLYSVASWRQLTGQEECVEDPSLAAEATPLHAEATPLPAEATTPATAETSEGTNVVVSAKSGGESAIALALQQLDMEILLHTQQIESLQRVRSRMCGLLY